jgi:hypothetical protein
LSKSTYGTRRSATETRQNRSCLDLNASRPEKNVVGTLLGVVRLEVPKARLLLDKPRLPVLKARLLVPTVRLEVSKARLLGRTVETERRAFSSQVPKARLPVSTALSPV